MGFPGFFGSRSYRHAPGILGGRESRGFPSKEESEQHHHPSSLARTQTCSWRFRSSASSAIFFFAASCFGVQRLERERVCDIYIYIYILLCHLLLRGLLRQRSAFQVHRSGLRVEGLRFEAQGSGLKIEGLGFEF